MNVCYPCFPYWESITTCILINVWSKESINGDYSALFTTSFTYVSSYISLKNYGTTDLHWIFLNTFIYDLILIKVSGNSDIMKTQNLYWRSHKFNFMFKINFFLFTFYVWNLILPQKISRNDHNMKYFFFCSFGKLFFLFF